MPRRVKTVTTINGKRLPESKAKVSVFDNALLYAEGLFETFLAIEDRVVFVEEHLDRLFRGASIIDLKIPVTRRTLERWMKTTIKAHPGRIKKLRLTITSGEAARWVGVQGKPQVILSASPHEMPAEPFRLHVSDWKVDQDSVFRRIKTISYAIHAAALKQARQAGCDDALLINENNEIAEVTSANIFWVKKGKIYTPPLSAGCLEGITRERVLWEARRLRLPVVEKTERLSTMLRSEEIFISSSLKLVIGVSEISDSKKRYRFGPGEVTARLKQCLDATIIG
ncbi:MAG: hypothetical protein GY867_08995 [bacterium]|nr:hypothetical protein [bacterium]